MERSSQHPALILHTRPYGESHLFVDLLTADRGLLTAAAYGARSQRGSLRGSIAPFTYGVAYLYFTPRSGVFKVTDFDVKRYYQSVRDSLDAFYYASLWAEIVLRTFGGGDGEDGRVLTGLTEVLDAMEVVVENREPVDRLNRLSAQWIWRYAEILGVQPDLPREHEVVRRFAPGNHGFVSRESAPGGLDLLDGTARYLSYTASLAMKDVPSVPMKPETEENLRRFVLLLAQDLVHGSLNTLQFGWVP